MLRFPRVALGSVQPEADTQFVSWALLELLTRNACQTQHFFARGCFVLCNGAITAAGLASRHLDSWLMTPELCREFFMRGAGESELSLVEGAFDVAFPTGRTGGSLDELCECLDLPRLVVLDVTRLENCRLPKRPQADGLILDRISSATQYHQLRTSLETLWGIPVVGALEELPAVRDAVRALPAGSVAPPELCKELGDGFARWAQLEAITRLANRRDLPAAAGSSTGSMERQRKLRPKVTVAVAYDEVFHGYFPDTLDMLEYLGATVVDFSPLHDEQLPADVDLVYIGCGRPDQHADALAENHCMMTALRTHLCAGRRMYADGGGLAYLCQFLETSGGKMAPMVGVLPAIARLKQPLAALEPVELTLVERSWLGEPDGKLRGYLNPNWQIESNGNLTSYLAEEDHKYDLVGRYQALGSRLQIHFAAQPNFLRSFVEPVNVVVGAALKG